MRVHTSHVTIGKKIPLNSNVVVIDTTVKSANSQIGKALAPTWDMVLDHKDGSVSDEDYCIRYGEILKRVSDDLLASFKRAQDNVKITDVIVTCYCGKGEFCHRHIAARYLCHKLKLEMGWEVTSDDVEVVRVPNGSVLSIISESVHPLEKIEECLDEYIEAGTVTIVNKEHLAKGHQDVSAISELTAKLLAYKDTTVIDVTGILNTMYVLDNVDIDREKSVDDLVTGFIRNPQVWGTIVPNDLEGLVETVTTVGFTDHVNLTRSYFNYDHANRMDNLFLEQVV